MPRGQDEYSLSPLRHSKLNCVTSNQGNGISQVLGGAHQCINNRPIAGMKDAGHVLEDEAIYVTLAEKPPVLLDQHTSAIGARLGKSWGPTQKETARPVPSVLCLVARLEPIGRLGEWL